MSLRLEDLPSWAQEQALRKLAEQTSRRAFAPCVQKGKYRNEKDQRTTAAGARVTFDSKKEARRFDELYRLMKEGAIRELRLQPQYTLQEAYTTPEGRRVRAIRYQADFSYKRKTEPDKYKTEYWVTVVEDVKSKATKTRAYEIKKKLLLERMGIDISEV